MMTKNYAQGCLITYCLFLSGCTSLISRVTQDLADDLAATILNSQDVTTVQQGMPAYLLMLDSFLRNQPEDPNLLLTASNLNGAFSTFTEGDRNKLLNQKARDYALRASCIENSTLCDIDKVAFKDFKVIVDRLNQNDIRVIFALGVAWAGWIQANSDDWNAIAQLARVKHLMWRVIELDETYDNGGAHLYIGALETLLPASVGGQPDKGRDHFEQAIAIAHGQYLMAKVIYAEQYAKLVFDKALHDRLLREVLAADPVVEGMTLINSVAQQRAKLLLIESDNFF